VVPANCDCGLNCMEPNAVVPPVFLFENDFD